MLRSRSSDAAHRATEQSSLAGCKRDGSDRLYGERVPIEIDDDVRIEYWTTIRELPQDKAKATTA